MLGLHSFMFKKLIFLVLLSLLETLNFNFKLINCLKAGFCKENKNAGKIYWKVCLITRLGSIVFFYDLCIFTHDLNIFRNKKKVYYL